MAAHEPVTVTAKASGNALADTLKGMALSVTELAEVVQQDGYGTTSPNFRTTPVEMGTCSKREPGMGAGRGHR